VRVIRAASIPNHRAAESFRIHSSPGSGLPRTHLVSRIRRDAALFEPARPRTGRRGRPAKKGARLPTPAVLAIAAPDKDWTRASINRRGRKTEVDLLTRAVLW